MVLFRSVIGVHTHRYHIILFKSYKNTTYLIIGPGKSSACCVSIHGPNDANDTWPIFRFQKAIKKVRATQRMRRNRGFAFSQTENAGKQDQAKLIRAYDTSKTSARPSGY